MRDAGLHSGRDSQESSDPWQPALARQPSLPKGRLGHYREEASLARISQGPSWSVSPAYGQAVCLYLDGLLVASTGLPRGRAICVLEYWNQHNSFDSHACRDTPGPLHRNNEHNSSPGGLGLLPIGVLHCARRNGVSASHRPNRCDFYWRADCWRPGGAAENKPRLI